MALNGIPILEEQCIGDSLQFINQAFLDLDSRTYDLSAASTYTTVNSNSANWGNAYTTVNSNSAAWGSPSITTTYTDLTGTGSQSVFAISGYVSTLPEKYLVHVGGLYQRPGINYTVGGGNITFTTSPPNGALVCVLALQ